MFTDIEGSTRLLEELGTERYGELLARHHRVCRVAWGAHGGVEVDTAGDAFFVAFATASGALAAAGEAQEALRELGLRVRMGVHTGEVSVGETGYVGFEVHRAARIAAAAHGGQVVVSASTAALVGTNGLVELGEHRFKDVEEPVAIFQLGEGSFPPLRTLSNTNLPRSASSFVGRELELSEVLSRFEQGARLITLTGPGGSGKTRLALEAASTLVPQLRAGVFWVGLASLRDSALVVESIAQTLGAKDGLAEHVGERELLLLLDNLEQVIDAAPELSALLRVCPNLRLLVTSRELLRVDGEVEYAVPPLAEREAVALFCERAQAEPSEEVRELCARLDNLPLAVELAAARTRALSPAQILERLSQRLDLLKGGRDADPRQQTLRATIEWSYDLLDAEEQRLFRAMSVFAGGCTLDAAEQVAGADLDTLQSLVEKSLLRYTSERYWMLETIREYAAERLRAGDDHEEVARNHAEWMTHLVASKAPRLGAPAEVDHTRELEDELDNLRAALSWTMETGSTDSTLSLVGGMGRYWFETGAFAEASTWAHRALAMPGGDAVLRAHALLTSAMSTEQERPDAALAECVEAAERFRQKGQEREAALADMWAAGVRLEYLGDATAGIPLLEQSLETLERLGDQAAASVCRGNLIFAKSLYAEDPAELDELIEAMRTFATNARSLDRFDAQAGYVGLGLMLERAGRHGEAITAFHEGLLLAGGHSLRDLEPILGLARSSAATGKPYEAIVYAAAARAIGREMHRSMPVGGDDAIRDLTDASRAAVGGEAATRAAARGDAMALTDLLAYLGEQRRDVGLRSSDVGP